MWEAAIWRDISDREEISRWPWGMSPGPFHVRGVTNMIKFSPVSGRNLTVSLLGWRQNIREVRPMAKSKYETHVLPKLDKSLRSFELLLRQTVSKVLNLSPHILILVSRYLGGYTS